MKYLILLILMSFTLLVQAQEIVSVRNTKNVLVFNTVSVGVIVNSINTIEKTYNCKGNIEIDIAANTVFIRYKNGNSYNTIGIAIVTMQNNPQGVLIYGRDIDYNEVSLHVKLNSIVLATIQPDRISTLTFSVH